MLRRSRKQLERDVAEALGKKARAMACYRLGVFHDNNSRESTAIPCYEAALRLGLDPATKAEALAWLASSLFKTDRPAEAWQRSQQALRTARQPDLKKFLVGLQARIRRKLRSAESTSLHA